MYPIGSIQKVKPSDITVDERLRTDYGDLAELSHSLIQFGQIQPGVMTPDGRLIAGGRRYFATLGIIEYYQRQGQELAAKATDQKEKDDIIARYNAKAESVVYTAVIREALTEVDLRELELEENWRRKDMSWKESALGIYRIHTLRSMEAARAGIPWGQRETGIKCGLTIQRVSQVLPVAKELADNPNSPLHNCSSFAEAQVALLEIREKQALALITHQQASRQNQTGSINSLESTPANTSAPQINKKATSLVDEFLGDSSKNASNDVIIIDDNAKPQDSVKKSKTVLTVDLNPYIHVGSCLEHMQSFIKTNTRVSHIICDPPYGIDMNMVQQANIGLNVESTVNEHQVEENLELLKTFVPLAHKVLGKTGFLIMFCDYMHFRFLHDLGVESGFAVQRWPGEWLKVLGQNGAASYNMTKTSEPFIVMRKQGTLLASSQPLNYRQFSKTSKDKMFDHPFAKPRELWHWLVDIVSSDPENDVIYDPFAGSGSSICSFITKGRQWLASEVNANHIPELVLNVTRTYAELNNETTEIKTTWTP